jgi:hypothetical protein
LDKAEASERWFIGERLTRVDIQEFADNDGYRTAADWLASRKQQLRVLRHFVQAPAFKKLWALLREHDKKGIGTIPSYSPARGSMPARLLQAIEEWHKAPKLTSAERKRLSQKIAKTCEELRNPSGASCTKPRARRPILKIPIRRRGPSSRGFQSLRRRHYESGQRPIFWNSMARSS